MRLNVDGKGKLVPVRFLVQQHAMKAYWGVELQLHSFFDLCTWWRWVVSFTPRPIYSQGKSPCNPLNRRLGGPQSRSGRGDEEKNSQPLRESNPRTPIIQPVAQRYADWAITALTLNVTENIYNIT
jgi:hypothetical protein